jgi:hypothetical protein
MPVTDFHEYSKVIGDLLDALLAAGQVERVNLDTDQRSRWRGFIAGAVWFEGETVLHFREFVDVTQPEPRLMYAYHYQDARGELILRYDNAVHRPALPQPMHKHTPSGATESTAPTLAQVVDEILRGQ